MYSTMWRLVEKTFFLFKTKKEKKNLVRGVGIFSRGDVLSIFLNILFLLYICMRQRFFTERKHYVDITRAH